MCVRERVWGGGVKFTLASATSQMKQFTEPCARLVTLGSNYFYDEREKTEKGVGWGGLGHPYLVFSA